ncbi:MbnP family protein [Nonlabens sp. SY33080]|uniref:MbnP family protein n=1 Tax=Nonlabens sp. SY33080 TaxID=2719911 RepID=UPI001428CF2D|nr:MbnP family protein [Nonlabens sp. SY33080]
MKLNHIFSTIALTLILTSCSTDDDSTGDQLEGQQGDITIKFDNAVGSNDFLFNNTYSLSNGDTFQVQTLKYIISNIVLLDEKGNETTIPAIDNIFIVDESQANNAGEFNITLNDIDAGNYTQIKFGIGVDQDRYTLGAAGQGNFLQQADDAGMMWSWATGYKFIRLDGTYTDSNAADQALNIHMGSVGTSLDNYREITLDLPNTSRVRENSIAEIHVIADIMKIFEGSTTVSFADGYNQVHTNEVETPIIAQNFSESFSVHHVHNN